MKKIMIVLLLSFGQPALLAQTVLSGHVFDKETHEPLAFANIVFNDNSSLSAISDIDGKFRFVTAIPIHSIRCSYTGYQSYTQAINGQSSLVVFMLPAMQELREIAISPKENPANDILRKVVANRNANNPEKHSSFRYTCYNKMVFDFLYHKNKRDSIALGKTLKKSHLLLTESVTRRKFLQPNWNEEVVLATRVSGFKNPALATLATDLQPFSFYQEYIQLFDIRYLNPIADGALKKYRYRLEETIYHPKDTLYLISFQPIRGKNFDGLKGTLYISSNNYAIQNVIASPYEEGKIDLKIQQQYQCIDGRYWFPEQLNYTMTIKEYPNRDIGIYSEGKSYLSDVRINIPIDKKEFSGWNVRITEQATSKDSAFWNNNRYMPLSPVEANTYRVIDSIGETMHFDRYLDLLEKVSVGRFPFSYVDLDLKKTLLYNKYEGLRLGTGIFTNSIFSRDFEFTGFFGYGLKDGQWKYGGGVAYRIDRENDWAISAKYENDLKEIGSYGLARSESDWLNYRRLIGYAYDHIERGSLSFLFRNCRFAQWKISLSKTQSVPKYAYQFQDSKRIFSAYHSTELSIGLRYAYGEKKARTFGDTYSPDANYPILYLSFFNGFKALGGEFAYTKIEIATEQSIYMPNFGLTRYRLEGGYTNRSLPAGMLFTGEGSYDSDMPLVMKNTFQTMRPYEFLSDRYVNLFLAQQFGTLLFKARHIQPRISIHHNIGWGALSDAGNHLALDFKTKEQVFVESGLQLDNLVKVNYANLGYIGLGTAAFYRYGAYRFDDSADNLALKITLNLTIK